MGPCDRTDLDGAAAPATQDIAKPALFLNPALTSATVEHSGDQVRMQPLAVGSRDRARMRSNLLKRCIIYFKEVRKARTVDPSSIDRKSICFGQVQRCRANAAPCHFDLCTAPKERLRQRDRDGQRDGDAASRWAAMNSWRGPRFLLGSLLRMRDRWTVRWMT